MGQTPAFLPHRYPPLSWRRAQTAWPESHQAGGGQRSRMGQAKESRGFPGKDPDAAAPKRFFQAPQGGAALEFALVLPLFLVLWFAVIDFGLAIYAKGLISHASQEGARFGAIYRLTPLTAGDIQSHVQTYLQGAGFTQPVTITVTGAGGPSGAPLSVRVDYVYHFLALPGFVSGIGSELTLSAEAVTRLE